MTPNHSEIIKEMHRLIDAANAKDIQLRVIGGLAVQLHNHKEHPLFAREFADLDFVIPRNQRREFEVFMPGIGYSPNKQFNVLNGAHRQIYVDDRSGMKVDIFVGDFEMCHRIPLEDRLSIEPLTIPLTELFLTKAQVVQLNRKDALDLTSILLNVEIGEDDQGRINRQVLAKLCSEDWGLYKTTSLNLEKLVSMLWAQEIPLDPPERSIVLSRVHEIGHIFEEMPKPLGWQLRDRVGTRVKWYMEVEEVAR